MMELFATLVLVVIAALILVAVRNQIGFYVTVAEFQLGILYSRGKLVRTLPAGRYWLWRPLVQQAITLVDTRLQAPVIGVQEIPTRDQVTIKVSAIVQYKVADPIAAIHKVDNYTAFIYQEVQLALRATLASLTLDELFAGKDSISESLTATLKPRGAEYGIDIQKVGVKDVSLPADVRAILAKSLDAERTARSSLIAAREELAATRCQANTAKVLRDNPIILKLKELSAMQEVAKGSGNTIVFSSPTDISQLLRCTLSPQEGTNTDAPASGK